MTHGKKDYFLKLPSKAVRIDVIFKNSQLENVDIRIQPMKFIIDSKTMELYRDLRQTQLVIHK